MSVTVSMFAGWCYLALWGVNCARLTPQRAACAAMPSSADNISLLRPNQYIHAIYSPTAYESHLEVSAELHLPNAETLNLTLYGRSNHSSLHLYPPEEEEEEEKGGDEGQKKAFYCCLPFLPNSESPNQSRCLLWFANQMVWNSTAKEKLPWKRTQKGWCQADGAGLLWSPRGKRGFTVRWKGDKRKEETIGDKEIGHSVFISFQAAHSLSPLCSHSF